MEYALNALKVYVMRPEANHATDKVMQTTAILQEC